MTPAIKRFDADASGIVSVQERKKALDAWESDYEATEAKWRYKFKYSIPNSSYRLPKGKMPTKYLHAIDVDNNHANSIADAIASQASFVGRILALGPKIVNDEWIDNAVTRYAQFLELAKLHPNKTIVPTLDVDLIWHAHMLTPLDYRDDCINMLGKVLSHDAQMGEGEIATAFEQTKERWHQAYGTPMVWREQQKTADKKKNDADGGGGGTAVYASCGSCGWGHANFHDSLPHSNIESAQIQHAYGTGGDGTSGDGVALGASTVMAEEALEGTSEVTQWAVDDHTPGETIMDDPWAPPPDSSSTGSDNGSSGDNGYGWGGESWDWGASGGDAGGGGDGGGGGCGGGGCGGCGGG